MGALVVRLVTSPTIKTEYLSRDGEWVEERKQAEVYLVHGTADEVAAKLRADGDEHVHAVVTEVKKPQIAALRRPTDNAPADFVMPAPRHRETRKERQARIARELREQDEREIEASYAE